MYGARGLAYPLRMPGIRPLLLALSAALAVGCASAPPRDAAPVAVDPPPAATAEAGPVADAGLSALTLATGGLDQRFQSAQPSYTSTQGFLVTRLRLRAEAADPQAAVAIGDGPAARGRASADLPLAVGVNRYTVVVTAADGVTRRTYGLAVERLGPDSLAQRAYTRASNADANDLFGYSLALDGDTLAVGAYLEDSHADGVGGDQVDNSADGSGAVYVFVRRGDDWLQQAYLKGSPAGRGRQFGRALALSGDTLAVGAPFDGAGTDPAGAGQAAESGAVHVFRRSGELWRQEAYLKAARAAAGDLFGSSVALAGETLAVGAYREDAADRQDSGAAYIFIRRSGGWSQEAHIRAAHPEPKAGFGYSLALSRDTLAIGAHLEGIERGVPGGGAAYVYGRDARGWSLQAHLTAPAPGRNDLFGASLALSGDTLAVGAHLEDGAVGGAEPAENSGAVYVYVRRNGAWSRQAYLKASPGGPGHRFGQGLALAGDTLAVGAYLEDGPAGGVEPAPAAGRSPESGAVYLFTRSGAVWTRQAYLKASKARPGAMFGYSLALSGELLAAGAPLDAGDAAGGAGGVVYLFR